jgi:MFS family permease
VACLNALRAVRALYIPLHGANTGMTGVQVGWAGALLSARTRCCAFCDASAASHSVLAVTLGFALDSLLIVPSGVLMDRRGRKLTGVPALLLLAAGVALIPSAQTPHGLAAVGILLGCGNGLSAGISGTLAADFSPPAPDTGAFLGLWRFVADGGSLVGPVAAGALSRRTNLGVAARCVGLFGVASAVWLAVMVEEKGGRDTTPRRPAGAGGGWAKALRRARRALAARLRAGLGRRQDGLRLLNA